MNLFLFFYYFSEYVKKKNFKILLLLTVALFPYLLFGQSANVVPFSPRTSPSAGNKTMYTIKGDFATVGNTNITWHPNYGTNKDPVNNWLTFVNIDPIYKNQLRNSSSATLVFSNENGALPECTRVLYAGVYWTGRPYTVPPATYPLVYNYSPLDYPPMLHDNLTDSVPVIIWKQDTIYTQIDEIKQWHPQNQPIPTNPPINFFPQCYPDPGPGFLQQITISGFLRFNYCTKPPQHLPPGFTSIPIWTFSYQLPIGPGWGPYQEIVGATFVPPPPASPLQVFFPPVFIGMNGLDSVMLSGIAAQSNCSPTGHQIQITTKVMRRDDKAIIDTVYWYRKNEIKLRHQSDTYFTLRAQTSNFTNNILWPKGDSYTGVYVGYADITDYVIAKGAGEYYVADIALQTGPSGTPHLFGGWGMVVVYENDEMIARSISVQDGYSLVTGNGNYMDVHIDGFNPVLDGPVGVRAGIMAGGGLSGLTGDAAKISMSDESNFTDIENPVNHTFNNFFAGSISLDGMPRFPSFVNNMGINIFYGGVSNILNQNITNEQHNTTLRFEAGDDTYVLYSVTASVFAHISEPQVEVVPLFLDGNPIINPAAVTAQPGSEIQYALKLRNVGSEPLRDLKIETLIPYLTEFVSAEIITYDQQVTSRTLFYPLIGAQGQLLWEVDYLPLFMGGGEFVYVELILTLKVTDDCNLLAVSGTCEPILVINGNTSGFGVESGFYFDDIRFIFGFAPAIGLCEKYPIYTPFVIKINSNCPSDRRLISVCVNAGTTTIPFETVVNFYPLGTRFYDTIDIISGKPTYTSIEFSSSNQFPAVSAGPYYAIPGPLTGAGLDCYWEFELEVHIPPTFQVIDSIATCEGDRVNLMDLISNIVPNNTEFKFFANPETTEQIDSVFYTSQSAFYYIVGNIPNSYGCYTEIVPVEIVVLPTIVPSMIKSENVVVCASVGQITLEAQLISEILSEIPNSTVYWYDNQFSDAAIEIGPTLQLDFGDLDLNSNIDTTFYVVIDDDDHYYCPAGKGIRKPVNVKIYPVPTLTLNPSHYNLCGQGTIVLSPILEMGTDRTNSFFEWWVQQPDGSWKIPQISPASSGAIPAVPRQYFYTPTEDELNQDSIILKVTIVPNICDSFEESVVFYINATNPDGEIEMVWQPEGEVDPCEETWYIVKVKETGLGGLTNITVTLDDYWSSLITPIKTEYFYKKGVWDIDDFITMADYDELDWEEIPFSQVPGSYGQFRALLPDNLFLENEDSLLVRFTVVAKCGFFSGNDYLFELNATTVCGSPSMPQKSVTTSPFYINFGDVEMPIFEVSSTMTPNEINNANPIVRTVEWEVTLIYGGGGEIDMNKDWIYFDIPSGMSMVSVTDVLNFYNLNAIELEGYETGYPDPTTKEYRIPLTYNPSFKLFEDDTVKFIITFTVDETISCETFPFYVEIIHEEELECDGDPTEPCIFGAILEGDYPDLNIDLYSFTPLFETTKNDFYGVMDGGDWSGKFRVKTLQNLNAGHIIKIVFYADENNNSVLNDSEVKLATILYEIDDDYDEGDTLEIDLRGMQIPAIDGVQFLVTFEGEHVCAGLEIPIVPLFGEQKFCVGDETIFYTANGPGIMAHLFSIESKTGKTAPIPLEIPTFEVKYKFTIPDTLTVGARYITTAYPGTYINWTYMDIIVYPYPDLDYVDEEDTTICIGTQVELSHFVYDKNDVETSFTFYKIEDNNSLTEIEFTADGKIIVAPWKTTTYKIRAINDGGCEAEEIEFEVKVVEPPIVWITIETQPTCSTPGSIKINISGGSGNYLYSKDYGNSYDNFSGLTNGIINGLETGSYVIYVLDTERPFCSPSISNQVIVTPNSGLYAIAETAPATGCDASNGTISVFAGNGVPNYKYSIDGENFFDIPVDNIITGTYAPNTYTIWVMDADSCIAATSATVEIDAGNGLSVDFVSTPATCKKDGILHIYVMSGVPPYSYFFAGENWIEMNSNPDSIAISAGLHTITVKDGSGCETTQTVNIGNVSEFSAKIDTLFNVSCQGNKLGSITLSITGGTIPIYYSFDAGLVTGYILTNPRIVTINNLQQGYHMFEMRDALGCTYTIDNIFIDKENDLLLIETKDSIVCQGTTVNLNSLITYQENVVKVKFFSNNSYTTEIINLNVDTTGWRWVRGYNIYDCFVSDSMFVYVRPFAMQEDITASNVNICMGGDTALYAFPNPSIVNTVITWYNDNTLGAEVLGTGYRLPITLPDVTSNLDTFFYVSVSGDNYCENRPANRRQVRVRVYQEPVLNIRTNTPDLCGAESFIINVSYNIGNDISGATYQWYHLNPVTLLYDEITSDQILAPNQDGNLAIMVSSFLYKTQQIDVDSGYVELKLTITTPVCGEISATVLAHVESGKPDGKIEMIWEPHSENGEDPCVETYYIVKVTETGDGSLSRIKVTMNDWRGSVITFDKIEYFHGIGDDENGVEPGWKIVDLFDLPWKEAVIDDSKNYSFTIILPDTLVLTNVDSLLVRFTVIPECGFYAGNNYQFVLEGTDACGNTSIGFRDTQSDIFNLKFGDAILPEFWLESEMDYNIITNIVPLQRIVTWTITWGYKNNVDSEIDSMLQSIYFNIPTGMSLLSIKSLNEPFYLDYDLVYGDSTFLKPRPIGFETGFNDPDTKEYEIPIPGDFYKDYYEEGNEFIFEIILSVDEGAECEVFELYVEIVHADYLECEIGQPECLFGFVKVGDYQNIIVDLYDLSLTFNSDQTSSEYGIMFSNGELFGGSFALITNSDLQEGHTIDVFFYADLNNNGILDDEDYDHFMGSFTYVIPNNIPAGEILIIPIKPEELVQTEYCEQLLVKLGGAYVCAKDAYPLITMFGPQVICEGDTSIYLTAGGMLYYNYIFSPVEGMKRIALEGKEDFMFSDSAARFVFTTPGKYTISLDYSPNQLHWLNRTIMEVTVTKRPKLALTSDPDTTICQGDIFELMHFFTDTTGIETLIEFYEWKDNNYNLIGNTGNANELWLLPWTTTVYRAVAYNNVGCIAYDSLDFTVFVNIMPQAFATVTTHPTCEGDYGSILISVSGGSGNYEYNFDGGNSRTQLPADGVINGLTTGTYTVYIYDIGNLVCSPVITEPPIVLSPPSGLYVTASSGDANGCEENDGTVTITPANGKSPYSYTITGNGINSSGFLPDSGITLPGMLPGNYNIIVKDVTNCAAATTTNVNIKQEEGIVLTLSQINPANCDKPGLMRIKVSGGVPPYSYRLVGGNYVPMHSDSISRHIDAGTSIVYIRDSIGCITYETIFIDNESDLFAELSDIVPVKCEGTSPGSITVTVSNAATPYNWSLNGVIIGTGLLVNEFTIGNLNTGPYFITITDDNNCTFILENAIMNEDRDMPVILKKDTMVCTGTEVNLTDLVLPKSISIDTVLFFRDRNHTLEIYPPLVNDTGYYYIKAFNVNKCFVVDSLHVKSFPYGNSSTITANLVKICNGSNATMIANTTGIINPYYRWFIDQDNTVDLLGTGFNQFTTLMPVVTTNTDTVFYISVEGDNLCMNPQGKRKPVTVTIYPTPQLSITADPVNLCGSTSTILFYQLNPGTDFSTVTGYNWQWKNIVTNVWQAADFTGLAGGIVQGYSGNSLPPFFTYSLSGTDLSGDSIVLKMEVLTDVCPNVSETIVFYNQSRVPQALFELIVQPLENQAACTDTVYTLKIKEVAGGLSNINVTLDDFLSSWLFIKGAKYLYPVIPNPDESDWEDADFVAGNKMYKANIPDLALQNEDSLLVKFTVNPICDNDGSSLAGLNLRFLLNANDFCNTNDLVTLSQTSEKFHLDWGNDPVASYWIEGTFSPSVITNGGSRKDTVVLTVSYAWTGGAGIPNYTNEKVYVNIPYPTLLDITSVRGIGVSSPFYDNYVPIYNPYIGETKKEWMFELHPGLVQNEIIQFEMKLAITDTIACGDYEFYVEIIREGDLYCDTYGADCGFLEILEGDYPILPVDLYHFTHHFSNDDEHFGVMKDGKWTGTYSIISNNEVFPGDSVMIVFYSDSNNNFIIDNEDMVMDTIYYPTFSHLPGMAFPVYFGQTIPGTNIVVPSIPTQDKKQLLTFISGPNVCSGNIGELVTVFGAQRVCVEEMIEFYTAPGMTYYDWGLLDTIKGNAVLASDAQMFSYTANTLPTPADSIVRVIFHKSGTYAIYTHFVPPSGEMANEMLAKTYIEIEVYAKPYLELTSRSDTTICFGGRVDLRQFVTDTVTVNNNQTLFHYSIKNTDGTYSEIGTGGSFIVAPLSTATYKISATMSDLGCLSVNSVEFTVFVHSAPRIEGIQMANYPTCKNNTGSLTIIVVEGSGNYVYSIDEQLIFNPLPVVTPPSYFTIQGLSAGSYTIYVKDNVNTACPASFSNSINIPNLNSNLQASAVVDSTSNCNSTDGIISLWINGGKYPYEYSIDGAPYVNYPIHGIIGNNFKSKNYTINVRDAEGCIASTGVFYIPAKDRLKLDLTLSHPAQCGTTGTIIIEVDGGIEPYQYHLNGFGWIEMNGNIDSAYVIPGHREVMVMDAHGCLASAIIDVGIKDSDLELDSLIGLSASCVGYGGGISFNATGNPKPLFYSLDFFTIPEYIYQVYTNPVEISGVPVGSYRVSLKDAIGCNFVTDAIDVSIQSFLLQAIDNYVTTYVDVPVEGNLVFNTYNINNTTDYLSDIWEGPYHGTISFNPPSGHYIYTPSPGFVGFDTVKYSVYDYCYHYEDAYLFITVLPLWDDTPRSPIAVDDYYYTYFNTPLTGENVLNNDVDPDGGTLSATLLGDATTSFGGTVTLNTDGTFIYTPRTGFYGVDYFWYEACNNALPSLCDTAIVYIYVPDTTNFDLIIRALDNFYTTPKFTPITINPSGILENDIYPDNLESLVLTVITTTKNGALVQNDDGSFIYTPNDHFVGSDGYTYEICGTRNGLTVCSQAYVNIFVYDNPCPDMPVLVLDSAFICIGDSVNLMTTIVWSECEFVDSVQFYTNNSFAAPMNNTFVSLEGYYYLKAFNVHGCFVEDSVYVTLFPLPTVTVTVAGKNTVACGGVYALFNLKTMAITGGDSLEFSRTKDFTILASPIDAFRVNLYDTIKLYVRGLNTITGCRTESLEIDSVTLIVVPHPSLSNPIVSLDTICTGGTTTFSSTLSHGTGTQTYQWEYLNGSVWSNVANGTPPGATYSGVTTNSLTVSGITALGTHSYRLTATMTGSGCDKATSVAGKLQVVADPVLSIPSGVSIICSGGNTTLSSTLSNGTGTPTYQWQYYNGSNWINTFNGTPAGANYAGATTNALTISGITAAGFYQYRLTANMTGSACALAISVGSTLQVVAFPNAPQLITDILDAYPMQPVDLGLAVDSIPGVTYTYYENADLTGVIVGSIIIFDPAKEDYYVTAKVSDAQCESVAAKIIVRIPCPDTVGDLEGNIYKVTALAGLCWTENLVTTIDPITGENIVFAKPYTCNGCPAKLDTIFGLLYIWYAAVGENVPNADGFIQGICPNGWHLPSILEWSRLNRYDAMKLKSTLYWLTPPGPGTDNFGFDARPAGWFSSAINRYVDLYGFAGWWASDDIGGGQTANYFKISYYCNEIEEDRKLKLDALSVRCVKDY
jgi:uncharacterized protein (TIGR02145 family)